MAPYRDDAEAMRRHVEAVEAERDEARELLARARAGLASAVAEMSRLPPEADIPWRSLHGGEPIRARFVNRTGDKLTLVWVSYDGQARPSTTLVPGGALERETFTAHLWRMEREDGAVVAQGYVTVDAPGLRAELPARSLEAPARGSNSTR